MLHRTIHEIHPVSDGTHILIYDKSKESGGAEYVFSRKIFVGEDEYRPVKDCYILGSDFREIFRSDPKNIFKWFDENPENDSAKMIAIGPDFQLLSIGEFKGLFG